MNGSIPMTNPAAVVLFDLTDPAVQEAIRDLAHTNALLTRERMLRRLLRSDVR